jgi:hypothetical protein
MNIFLVHSLNTHLRHSIFIYALTQIHDDPSFTPSPQLNNDRPWASVAPLSVFALARRQRLPPLSAEEEVVREKGRRPSVGARAGAAEEAASPCDVTGGQLPHKQKHCAIEHNGHVSDSFTYKRIRPLPN